MGFRLFVKPDFSVFRDSLKAGGYWIIVDCNDPSASLDLSVLFLNKGWFSGQALSLWYFNSLRNGGGYPESFMVGNLGYHSNSIISRDEIAKLQVDAFSRHLLDYVDLLKLRTGCLCFVCNRMFDRHCDEAVVLVTSDKEFGYSGLKVRVLEWAGDADGGMNGRVVHSAVSDITAMYPTGKSAQVFSIHRHGEIDQCEIASNSAGLADYVRAVS